MFQVSQHFRSSETQAVCDSTCFSRQSVCSVISLHSGMFRAAHPRFFSKVDVEHRHMPVWASRSTFHFGTRNQRWHRSHHILQDTNGTGSQKAHYQGLIFGNALPSSKVRSRRNESDQITGKSLVHCSRCGTVGMKRIEKIWVGKNKKCRVPGSGQSKQSYIPTNTPGFTEKEDLYY